MTFHRRRKRVGDLSYEALLRRSHLHHPRPPRSCRLHPLSVDTVGDGVSVRLRSTVRATLHILHCLRTSNQWLGVAGLLTIPDRKPSLPALIGRSPSGDVISEPGGRKIGPCPRITPFRRSAAASIVQWKGRLASTGGTTYSKEVLSGDQRIARPAHLIIEAALSRMRWRAVRWRRATCSPRAARRDAGTRLEVRPATT